MLEICVSLRRSQGEGTIGGSLKPTKMMGDIIAAKVFPAVWGEMEKRFFLITLLDDPTLESKISIGNVFSYPYAVYDDNENDPKIMNRSKYRVDLDMFIGSPGLDPDDNTSEPCPPNGKDNLELSDLIFDDLPRV